MPIRNVVSVGQLRKFLSATKLEKLESRKLMKALTIRAQSALGDVLPHVHDMDG